MGEKDNPEVGSHAAQIEDLVCGCQTGKKISNSTAALSASDA